MTRMSEQKKDGGLGRRRARRTHLLAKVGWRVEGEGLRRTGVLVGVSGTGLAMITDHQASVRCGARIHPTPDDQHPGWRKPAVIRRVDRISDALDLLAAEYVEPTTDVAWGSQATR